MAVSHFNENEKDRIAHCWCSIKVLEAWEQKVQDKAMNDEPRDLFPNLVRANRIAPDEAEDPVPAAEDPDAFYDGQVFFLAPADEEQEEWEEWLDHILDAENLD